MQARPIDVHDILLIAARVGFLPLKNQLLARTREIRLGVLATEGQLANVAEMDLARIGGDVQCLQQCEKHGYEHWTGKVDVNGVTGNRRWRWC